MSGKQIDLVKLVEFNPTGNADQFNMDFMRADLSSVIINGETLKTLAAKHLKVEVGTLALNLNKHFDNLQDETRKVKVSSLLKTILTEELFNKLPNSTDKPNSETFYDYITKRLHGGGMQYGASALLSIALAMTGDYVYRPAESTTDTCDINIAGDKININSKVVSPSSSIVSSKNIEQKPYHSDTKPSKNFDMELSVAYQISYKDKKLSYTVERISSKNIDHILNPEATRAEPIYQALESACRTYAANTKDKSKKKSFQHAQKFINTESNSITVGSAFGFIMGQSGDGTKPTSLRVIFLNELAKAQLVTLPEGGIKDNVDVYDAAKSLVTNQKGSHERIESTLYLCASDLERLYAKGNFLDVTDRTLRSVIKEIDSLESSPSIAPAADSSFPSTAIGTPPESPKPFCGAGAGGPGYENITPVPTPSKPKDTLKDEGPGIEPFCAL